MSYYTHYEHKGEPPSGRVSIQPESINQANRLWASIRNCVSVSTMSGKIHRSNAREEYWFQEGCHITEVANNPEDCQVSIARARLEPGLVTKWHCLHETWERYLIIAGAGVAEIGDLEPTPVSAGDVVSIPPDTRQRIRNTGNQDLVFYAICSPRFTPVCYRSLE